MPDTLDHTTVTTRSSGTTDVDPAAMRCLICSYNSADPLPEEIGSVRGNTERFKQHHFSLWRCPNCRAIHAVEAVDMADIYSDYPLNRERPLDVFARGTFRNLLKRLTANGLQKQHSILDYGCGGGIYVTFLQGEGFTDVTGYDPFVQGFDHHPGESSTQFDCVIANDVIEHVDDPRTMMADAIALVKPGGLLYVGTADATDVTDMSELEPHIMRLHQPFHRVILTPESLAALGPDFGLLEIARYRRSYMDTCMPFSNYRFLDEFNKAHGHVLDAALAPDGAKIVLRKPSLLLYALFGYFIPSAIEPAVLWRKPA